MDMMPAMSEAETLRREQIRGQRERDCRAQTWSRWRRMVVCGVRRIFIFLLGAALVTFIVAHRNQINLLTANKVSIAVTHLQTKTDTADPLRQGALEHEKEVEDAAK
jgi:hypothetical protein